MGYKTWVFNEIPTATVFNDEIRDQVISRFATEAARDAAISLVVPGQFAVTNDTGTLWQRDGSGNWRQVSTVGAWTTYVTSTSQPAPLPFTTNYSRVTRVGRMVTWAWSITMGATAGTAGNAILLTLPAPSATSAFVAIGSGQISAAAVHVGVWRLFSPTQIGLLTNGNNNYAGATPSFALNAGHTIDGTVVYEASS